MGRRVAQDAGRLHAGQLPGLDRPVPGQPRRRHARPGAAALPADAGLLRRRGLRRAGHAGRTRSASPAYGVSVETVRRGARPRSPGRGVASVQIILNAFRLKPLERVLPAAAGGRRRHHRPGPAGQRPALRPVRRAHHVRRRRPPHLQPARRGVRRRRDVLRGRLRDRARGGAPAAPRWCPTGGPWPSSRCAGSSTSPASPWSSPAPATPTGPRQRRRRPTCRRCPPTHPRRGPRASTTS